MTDNSTRSETESSWSLNENLLVFDQYYKKRIKSAMSAFEINLLSSINQSIINYFLKSNKSNQLKSPFKYEQKDLMKISNFKLKLLNNRLSTTQDLEDYLSLQDIETLRKYFYDAIRKKLNIIMSNTNFNNDLKSMKRAGSSNNRLQMKQNIYMKINIIKIKIVKLKFFFFFVLKFQF